MTRRKGLIALALFYSIVCVGQNIVKTKPLTVVLYKKYYCYINLTLNDSIRIHGTPRKGYFYLSTNLDSIKLRVHNFPSRDYIVVIRREMNTDTLYYQLVDYVKLPFFKGELTEVTIEQAHKDMMVLTAIEDSSIKYKKIKNTKR